ncbi:TPA: flagellin, partial [Clostridioides difficile]
TNDDRAELQKEVAELTKEVNRISTDTEFNTKKLLDGAGISNAVFHIGANAGQAITLSIGNMGAASLAIDAVDISTQTGANAAISSLDAAIKTVSSERAKLGANQNRLEHTINNLGTTSENLSAAESRVRDVDMAKEMMNQTKNNILAQASQAMLAQANQQPQAVLQLLR